MLELLQSDRILRGLALFLERMNTHYNPSNEIDNNIHAN
jgi:hypothetical protein